jgi:2OG-Fe(II) oxygenase superfamily
MIPMLVGLALAIVSGLTAFAVTRRAARYRDLSSKLAATAAKEKWPTSFPAAVPDFSNNLTSIDNVLPDAEFAALRSEIETLANVERSYVPTHKKGGTIAYATLIGTAPQVTRLYHSTALHRFLSRIAGTDIRPTPIHDQSSLSILVYEQPGDHIDWHYDHNFYRGRHFTVLVPIVNRGTSEQNLSHAELSAKVDNEVRVIKTPPNSLIMFEGARVLHKVSPILAGERRILISMTFCADPRASWAQEIARRLKDTAFFGVRALWT